MSLIHSDSPVSGDTLETVEVPKDKFEELTKKYNTLYEDYSTFNRSLQRQRKLSMDTKKQVETFVPEVKETIVYMYHELKHVKKMNLLLLLCVVAQAILILKMWYN